MYPGECCESRELRDRSVPTIILPTLSLSLWHLCDVTGSLYRPTLSPHECIRPESSHKGADPLAPPTVSRSRHVKMFPEIISVMSLLRYRLVKSCISLSTLCSSSRRLRRKGRRRRISISCVHLFILAQGSDPRTADLLAFDACCGDVKTENGQKKSRENGVMVKNETQVRRYTKSQSITCCRSLITVIIRSRDASN